MNYSQYVLRIQALTRLMHECCQTKDYQNAYLYATEIEIQAQQFKQQMDQQ
jgi:hypothetical protein